MAISTEAVDKDDDDDWLARARSRRQQMLKKEETGSTQDSKSASVADVGDADNLHPDSQSLKVDLSSVM